MRNLGATSCTVLPAEKLLGDAQHFCLDCDRGAVWIATRNELCSIENNNVNCVAPLSGHFKSDDDCVIGMEYLSDSESVCLALSGGNILLYSILTSELESVGEIGVGVVCMGWSPEQDVVVLVTGENKLILMTKEFDPLTEKALHQEDFGEGKFVTVGWGKKETQFHGLQGKPKPEQLQQKASQPAVAWDDRQTRLSWRGDGEYFACSTVDPSSQSRVIRVWSRECVLHSTSETINGLEHTLAWKPSGSLLACTQLKPHRSDIIFLERNGLHHGEFPFKTLPTNVHVKELSWSADSAVLGVWCVSREDGEEWVQLWTVGNYHWYLKQEVRLAKLKEEDRLVSPSLVGVVWDPMVPLKLHLLTRNGQYISYLWHWVVSESRWHSHLNVSGVTVIDGAQVLYTPFRFAIVPPPMSSKQLPLSAPVNEVVFSPPPRCNDFLAVLCDFQVAVFSVSCDEPANTSKPVGVAPSPHPTPQLVGVASIGDVTRGFHALRQFVWWREDCLLAVAMSDEIEGGVYREGVVQFSLAIDRKKSSVEISKCSLTLAPGPILCLHGNPDTGNVVVQLTSGEVMRVSPDPSEGCGLSPWLLDSGSCLRYEDQVHCDKMELAVFDGKERVVGLCEYRGWLYVDDLKVTTGCTSFYVHDEFLLVTTNTHICRFISLYSDPKVIEPLPTEKQLASDISIRRVERGSKIVTVIPADFTVILQMPRGNLETISPRALVLAELRRNLDKLEFRTAFRCMRKHRLNLNFLYDHNPKAFMANIPRVIEQLGSVNYLNLFLTALSNEDVCKTLYPGGVVEDGPNKEMEPGSKVDRVCEAVRRGLTEAGEDTYLLSIITSYVRMSQPKLETVLSMIQKRKEIKSELEVTAEAALKYTMYLVDVDTLYDVALGMYNLPLVVMVAEKSQKDPKEYLPFLNDLNKLPCDYQHYKIDSYLKRYGKALHHIVKCGQEKFEECLSLIKAHNLFKEALTIYTDRKSSEYKEIASGYGHHLLEVGKHKDAGIILFQCGCYQEAALAFEKACSWEQVFVCCGKLHLTRGETIETARRLAASLKDNRRFAEAGRVLLDYAEDVEEAVVSLLEGSLWQEALRLLHLHHRSDLLETHLLPGLLEAQMSQLALFESLHSKFSQHASRLVVVRETKKQKQAAILEGTYAADEKDADLFSDTSSVTGQSAISSLNTSLHTSVYSKATGRSSKNRRKAERKRMSLREGSVHEEEALVEALREIVTTVDSLQDDMMPLLPTLVQFGYTKEAGVLQGRLVELLEAVRQGMESVWPCGGAEVVGPTDVQKRLGPDATVNSIIAAMTATKLTSIVRTGGPAPTLRGNVQWRLDYFLY